MYDILYPTLNGGNESACRAPVAADPEAEEFWRFTDPVAWALYRHEGRLDQLQEDVQAYVMCAGQWAPDELEYDREIRRLLDASALRPKGTFSYLSPNPTVYRATQEGELKVNGRRFHFDVGEDVVFEPWLARASSPGLCGPLRIGRLRSLSTLCLCGEAFPRASLLCERALGILQQTLPNGATASTSQNH